MKVYQKPQTKVTAMGTVCPITLSTNDARGNGSQLSKHNDMWDEADSEYTWEYPLEYP